MQSYKAKSMSAADPTFLPFEHSLLRDHIWCDTHFEASLEEVVSQIRNVIKGVVVCHNCVGIVGQVTFVNHLR